jgi:hypothetical protein
MRRSARDLADVKKRESEGLCAYLLAAEIVSWAAG